MHEQALEPFDGEVRGDGRDAEAEHDQGNGHRGPGERHVDRVSTIGGEPVHRLDGVVEAVESPQDLDLVGRPVAPVSGDLAQHETLEHDDPARLQSDAVTHHVRHDELEQGDDDQERCGEHQGREDFVEHEVHAVGGEARPENLLAPEWEDALESDEEPTQEHQPEHRVGSENASNDEGDDSARRHQRPMNGTLTN